MPKRKRPLTPWGKEVKKRMIDSGITSAEIVERIRALGILITCPSFSEMLSGNHGMRSPGMVAEIEKILQMPADIEGRPV